MNKLRYIPICILAAIVLSGCRKDDALGQGDTGRQANVNANDPRVAFSTRLEIPRLKGGAQNMFLVKEARLSDTGSQTFVNYCVEYDCSLKASRWTAFRWDINNTKDNNAGYDGGFAEDTAIPAQYRVTLSDHVANGYDRGHMLASEDRQCSRDANRQTFLLSNMQPQYHLFNGYSTNPRVNYVWLNLEAYLRSLYKSWTPRYNSGDTIYVVKGGTIDNRSQILETTSRGLIVPRYFYVALLYKSAQAGYKAIAFWIEHTNGKDTTTGEALKKYCISIDELERKTGIDFFCNLPDNIENEVEAKCVPKSLWP